jgi:ATP-dependent DNA helicase RecQ
MQRIPEILRKYWGYEGFRPLQQEAIEAVIAGRDSVVVLPTGGGKSLCFQAPALALPGLAVVVSPLLSLMKDQVDGLADCGVPAACVNSSHDFDQRRRVADEIRAGRLKLLYLSPERLMSDSTLAFLEQTPLSFFAIDEAHCISDWGHDFRPEYRALGKLRQIFPQVAIHAYTATATERVRADIARELQLRAPVELVGSFDRPNLLYRAQRRTDRLRQIREVLDRHADESGIVYCIRRADVEEVCAALNDVGHSALPYHAGLSDEVRQKNQEAFINDRARIIVATVAFGMGIDKSDVRFVIHAGAPKSLEAYQQESGRAGRDGLEAECCLLHSPGDFQTWRSFHQSLPDEARSAAVEVLSGIDRFCSTVRCRRQAILQYFGQSLDSDNCGACDVCLGELKLVDEPLVVAQKIISCVLRLEERFGGEYTAQVLVGSREQRILERGHEKLSTWGILKEHDKPHIRDWIEQLVDQGFLEKTGEYATLRATDDGWRLLRGERRPQLLQPAESSGRGKRESRAAAVSWDGVDRELFEELRTLRRAKASERGLPPYIIFADATLRDLARRRPSDSEALLEVHGIGEKKRNEYGDEFLRLISDYCRRTGAALDQAGQPQATETISPPPSCDRQQPRSGQAVCQRHVDR